MLDKDNSIFTSCLGKNLEVTYTLSFSYTQQQIMTALHLNNPESEYFWLPLPLSP